MKSIKTALLFALCVLLVAQSSAFAGYRPQPVSSEIELQLFFTYDWNHPKAAEDCGAGLFFKRKITATKQTANAALKLLFAGPTAEEKAKGAGSLAPLGDYYLGVSIKKGVAIVNFRPGAEEHLHVNGAICQSEHVTTPIEKTLKQFTTIKSVEYAINGKIIEEWDA